MSNIPRLFAPTPRQPKDHDRFTKAQLWARIAVLEKALNDAAKCAAGYARDCHNAGDMLNRERFHEVARYARAPQPIRFVTGIRKDGSAENDLPGKGDQ